MRRRRLRQDRSRGARGLQGDHGSAPSRGPGAHHRPRGAALPHLFRALCGVSGYYRAALALPFQGRAENDARRLGRRQRRPRHRHPSSPPARRGFLAPRPRHRRRGATFRRHAQRAPKRAAPVGRRLDAVRNAYPAHAAHGHGRRARSLPHPDAAGEPDVDQDRRRAEQRLAHRKRARAGARPRRTVYFVHNRVETIYGVAAAVSGLAPRARVAVGHGQMHMHELEDVMLRFVNGEIDILVSTTIIENGLDIPNVNTIVVNNADHFGLAQLYQLRGRVGRSAHQAYAYFLYQPHRSLSEVAQSRLEAIREFSHLGSGLQLAMRDLEIRGAGNLLGREQHGFIAAVGFETYCNILQEAVAARRGEILAQPEIAPVLDIRVSAYLPADYVKGTNQKVSFYQRLAAAQKPDEVDRIAEELRDRFGALPKEAQALLELTRLRVLATAKGVQKVALEQRRLTLDMGPKFSLSEQALPSLTSITGGNFRFTQGAIIAGLPSDGTPAARLASVRELLQAL